MAGIQTIGYFEDFNDFEVFVRYAYYWLTPFQYMKWRQEMYGKTMNEARAEFVWLRDNHQLITCTAGGECYFLIAVDTVEALQTWAYGLHRATLRKL